MVLIPPIFVYIAFSHRRQPAYAHPLLLQQRLRPFALLNVHFELALAFLYLVLAALHHSLQFALDLDEIRLLHLDHLIFNFDLVFFEF